MEDMGKAEGATYSGRGGWRGGGRPKGSKSKKSIREVNRWGQRWLEDEAQLVEETAERLGERPCILIREAVLEYCREIVKRHNI